jgi:hydrogenase maturation protease
MSAPDILIAGVGNIFLGDDAFGVEVVRRLALRSLHHRVRVIDFGIRGLDLTYALLNGYETVILVDAAPRGEPPGTLCLIEPQLPGPATPQASDYVVEMHSMDPVKVLRLARALGSRVRHLFLVGCEPATVGDDEMAMGMSAPVQQAIDEAIPLIESLVAKVLQGDWATVKSAIGNAGVV